MLMKLGVGVWEWVRAPAGGAGSGAQEGGTEGFRGQVRDQDWGAGGCWGAGSRGALTSSSSMSPLWLLRRGQARQLCTPPHLQALPLQLPLALFAGQ